MHAVNLPTTTHPCFFALSLENDHLFLMNNQNAKAFRPSVLCIRLEVKCFPEASKQRGYSLEFMNNQFMFFHQMEFYFE